MTAKIKRQKYSEDGEHRVPVKIRTTEEVKDALMEYCFTKLGISVSAYLNELIENDEGFKRWLREEEKKLNL